MNSNDLPVIEQEPPLFMLKELTVRVLQGQELVQAGQLLESEHYLGDCPQGRQLLQLVEYRGQWVALLDWGPACWKLADREAYIGWTHQQRAQRLALIVQNRRFLILGKQRMPNLASCALSLALKALPGHWQERYGYAPLMAETFTDIELFEGTCYKASNWTELGLSKGFQRHRADYFLKHDRPKKLWINSLNRNTKLDGATIADKLDLTVQAPSCLARAMTPALPKRVHRLPITAVKGIHFVHIDDGAQAHFHPAHLALFATIRSFVRVYYRQHGPVCLSYQLLGSFRWQGIEVPIYLLPLRHFPGML
jgi:hypothetical protein